MKVIIEREFGKLEYEESFWTGKKKIKINEQVLREIGKNLFVYKEEDGTNKDLYLTGSFVKGVKASFNGSAFEIVPGSKWYEYILAFLGVFMVLTWGNSKALCAIFPIVGGAIGGGISGVMGVLSLVLMKNAKNVLYKVLIGLGVFLATMLICFVIAVGIIPTLA